MSTRRLTEAFLIAIPLMIIVQLGYALQAGVMDGQLAEPDAYTWMVRATQLFETGNWFDSMLYRVDPPFGVEQHWTRPFDLLLAGGGWLLSPLLGFETGLYVWGSLLGPLLQAASILALTWAFLPILNHRQTIFLALGFLVQPALFAAFFAGRPDYHGLITLLLILSLGLCMRMMLEPRRLLWPWMGGLIGALALWLNIGNLLFIILPIMICLGILHVLRQKDVERAFLHYSASLFIFSFLALLAQNGWTELMRPEVDRISMIYILLTGLFMMHALVMRLFSASWTMMQRALFAALSGLFAIGLMYLIYPSLFSGIEIDPLYREIRTANIAHHTPIFSLEWPEGLLRFIIWTGILIPVFLWFAVLAFKQPWGQMLKGQKNLDIHLKASLLGLIILLAYALDALTVRYVHYVELICLPAYAIMMDRLVLRMEHGFGTARLMPLARALVIFLLLTWFYYPQMLFGSVSSNAATRPDNFELSRYLGTSNLLGDEPRNIMATPEAGPYLLYYTGHNVYTITNHRMKHGFSDWIYLLSSETDEKALEIIGRRQVDFILINDHLGTSYFRKAGERALVRRLLAGEIPTWLEAVHLPSGLADSMVLYRVKSPGVTPAPATEAVNQ